MSPTRSLALSRTLRRKIYLFLTTRLADLKYTGRRLTCLSVELRQHHYIVKRLSERLHFPITIRDRYDTTRLCRIGTQLHLTSLRRTRDRRRPCYPAYLLPYRTVTGPGSHQTQYRTIPTYSYLTLASSLPSYYTFAARAWQQQSSKIKSNQTKPNPIIPNKPQHFNSQPYLSTDRSFSLAVERGSLVFKHKVSLRRSDLSSLVSHLSFGSPSLIGPGGSVFSISTFTLLVLREFDFSNKSVD